MSATELGSSASTRTERSLWGWGRTAHSRATVTRLHEVEQVAQTLSTATRRGVGAIARGAGRSYGDAALNAGGEVLDMTGWDRVLSVDPQRRLLTAQAGATIAQLMAAAAPHELTLPVVPGTRHVTLGGAIASDIHGKNHHCDGALARHVVAITLCTPAGGCTELSPELDGELFYATLGGMGLTGVVVQATLALEPLDSPWVAVDVDRTDGLEQTLQLMAGAESHRYSVAWLDLLAEGTKLGRAVVTRADRLAPERAPRRSGVRRDRRAALLRKPILEVPRGFPGALLKRSGVRAFNAVRWGATPRSERQRAMPLAPYLFPLDGLGEWNRLYGAAGLIQYQFVVPDGQEATLVRCFEAMRKRALPVYLAVFKRFGEAFGGPLSFPLAGWTLAVDLPARAPALDTALRELDELIAGCGGRVYLTKDVRLRREMLPAMYPQLDRFQQVRARVDPDSVMRSDLARRLGLCAAADEH
jgi:decaprenylphospho-beta-D-ribofuranose 2-oxidase